MVRLYSKPSQISAKKSKQFSQYAFSETKIKINRLKTEICYSNFLYLRASLQDDRRQPYISFNGNSQTFEVK